MIRRRALIAAVAASLLAPIVAAGQPTARRFSIGYLVAVTPQVVAPYSAAIERDCATSVTSRCVLRADEVIP